MKKLFFVIIFLTFFCSDIFPQSNKIIVPTDQPTIQSAIDTSSDGDTVVVLPGRYFENIIFRGKDIVLTSRYYEENDTSFITSTIIDGNSPVDTDSASVVRIVNNEDSTTVLQGFTITGGTGTKWTDEHGAGVYREGGGILIALSSPIIKHNIIVNNTVAKTSGVSSAGGGGIRAGDGNLKILNNIITRNTGRYGAGIVLNYTGALVRNNIITQNSGGEDYGGGALWMNHDGPNSKTIENNTFTWNNVQQAIYVWEGSSIIRNCIIYADSTVSTVQIGVRSGGPTVTYSNVQGGWTGESNIDSPPQFSDFFCHLNDESPCVDAGDTTAIYNDLEDILSPGTALWPSKGTLRNDMGAYGGPGASELPSFSPPSGIPNMGNISPDKTRLEQNFPNPFNLQIRIVYYIGTCSYTYLQIFDILGREIATLVNEMQYPGKYTVEWNGINSAGQQVGSGVYFYQLKTGNDFVSTKKMLLLR